MSFVEYDCTQLEDVSSAENVHVVINILSQVFIRLQCCATVQPFVALELKGPLYMISYVMFTCRPFSSIPMAVPSWTRP